MIIMINNLRITCALCARAQKAVQRYGFFPNYSNF